MVDEKALHAFKRKLVTVEEEEPESYQLWEGCMDEKYAERIRTNLADIKRIKKIFDRMEILTTQLEKRRKCIQDTRIWFQGMIKDTGNSREVFNFRNQTVSYDTSEDRRTEGKRIKRINFAAGSSVCYRKKKKPLSAASNKSKKKKSSKSLRKYSWDNIPSIVENQETLPFDIDEMCSDFKNLSSNIEDCSNIYNREQFGSCNAEIKLEPY